MCFEVAVSISFPSSFLLHLSLRIAAEVAASSALFDFAWSWRCSLGFCETHPAGAELCVGHPESIELGWIWNLHEHLAICHASLLSRKMYKNVPYLPKAATDAFIPRSWGACNLDDLGWPWMSPKLPDPTARDVTFGSGFLSKSSVGCSIGTAVPCWRAATSPRPRADLARSEESGASATAVGLRQGRMRWSCRVSDTAYFYVSDFIWIYTLGDSLTSCGTSKVYK